jgi:hypothetical protein
MNEGRDAAVAPMLLWVLHGRARLRLNGVGAGL